ncbi:MAG TPA: hypothetical protein VGN88_00480 [Phycisphaerae bacterium]
MDSALFGIIALLASGVGLVIYLIAADKNRFLARIDLDQWREGYYLRSLPNFLQSLHDNHFRTAWPSSRNAVAAAYFHYRTRPLLKKKPKHLRRAFLNQHVILFGLIEVLGPYLQDFIFQEQQRIAASRVIEMEDTIERERLVAFIESVRAHRARFQRYLSEFDRQIIVGMVDRRIIQTLRSAHSIFQEHGYSLLPEFSQLRRWQEMTGTELVQELPHVPVVKVKVPREQPRMLRG